MKDYIFSAFVDDSPKYLIQSFIWSFSLTRLTGLGPENVHMCFHKDVSPDILSFYRDRGFRLSVADTFDRRSLPLNKLNQLVNPELQDYQKVVLMDTDLVVTASILNWVTSEFRFAADFFIARPPIQTFIDLYQKAGLDRDPKMITRPPDNRADHPYPRVTPANHFIGSLYAIDQSILTSLTEKWNFYANFCLNSLEIITPYDRNIDQIAMTMALDDLRILPAKISSSFSIGPNVSYLVDAPANSFGIEHLIEGYHFHSFFDKEGRVLYSEASHPGVVAFVEIVNAALDIPEKNLFLKLISNRKVDVSRNREADHAPAAVPEEHFPLAVAEPQDPVQRPQASGANVVVLGMHRSGTSLITSFLASRGLWAGQIGEFLEPQPDNPNGFWERADILQMNDRILEDAGGTWYRPLPIETASISEYQSDLENILGKLKAPWVIKDPRLINSWAAWSSLLSDAVIVYVYRNPISVARSLERRNGFPIDFGLALWEHNTRELLGILSERSVVVISYDAYCLDPEAATERLVRALRSQGVELLESGTVPFDASLNHSPLSEEELEALLLPSQLALHGICISLANEPAPVVELNPATPGLSDRIASMSDAFDRQIWLQDRHDKSREQIDGLNRERQGLNRELGELRTKLLSEEQRHVRESRELQGRIQERQTAFQERQTAFQELQQALVESEKKSNQLAAHYVSLSNFSRSVLGRLVKVVNVGYRTLTFRPGSTPYEQLIDAATQHVGELSPSTTAQETSRLGMVVKILRYVVSHPHSTLRNLSPTRIRRLVDQFSSMEPTDLSQWVDQRFPALPGGDTTGMPQLTEALDDLQLTFPTTSKPRVSIVIPVFNQYRMTINCLQSILTNTDSIDYEVIVGDDASSDLTEQITERISGIQVVRAEANQGFLRNCNDAVKTARGEFVVLLNNDTAVTAGWMEALLRVFDQDDSVGVVGPKLLFADGRLQEAGGIIWSDASGWNFGRGHDPAAVEYNYRKEVDYVTGACLAIRTTLWAELGGFDERYVPAYYEDVDVCFASRARGYKTVYQPEAQVFHFEGVSNGTDLGSGIKKYQTRNQQVFREKWSSVLDAEHFPNGESVFVARDRTRTRRTVVVIDHYVPFFDKDAGSRSVWMYLGLLVDMGYNVKFIGANFFPHQPYTLELQRLGIEVLVGERAAEGTGRWLQEHAAEIHTVYLNRPHVAEQFLADIQQMVPKPTIGFWGCDLHYLRKQREFAVTGDNRTDKEARDWRAREYRIFEQVDHIYYPSEVEVQEIREHQPQLPVTALPLYAFDVGEIPAYEASSRSGMIFVGGFGHPPNLDGLNWFIENVLPGIRQVSPDMKLHVVGSNTPQELLDLDTEDIVVHGFLSDANLKDLYQEVRLTIIPLRFGAGVKGKVLDGLQNGLPIVTTSVGAEGLPDAESVLMIADDAQAFVDQVLLVESGDELVTSRLERYQSYLELNFSRRRAENILEADFGAPTL